MRYYYTPHTILQLLRVACEPSADHVVVVVMFTCFHIYLLSVRTLCDPLYLPTLILRGACNQGERFFIFILVASLVDTRSVACVSVTMKQCVSVSMCTCYPCFKICVTCARSCRSVGRQAPPPHSSLGVLDFSQAKKSRYLSD